MLSYIYICRGKKIHIRQTHTHTHIISCADPAAYLKANNNKNEKFSTRLGDEENTQTHTHICNNNMLNIVWASY